MAAKPKADAPKDDEEEEAAEGAEAQTRSPKKGLVGRILGAPMAVLRLARFLNPLVILKLPLKQKLMAAGGLLGVLGGVGAAVYFLAFAPAKPADTAVAEVQTASPNLPAQEAAYFDVPDIIVNLQTADATPAYLKLSLSLELDKADEKAAIEPVMPRVVDQFQTYLRELRIEDIRGSAGVMRLKEELLRRVNLAVAPTPVRDVLLKEMIVQ